MKFSRLKNNGLAWTLLPLLCSAISPVFASADPKDSTELRVTGTISPSSCTLVLGTGTGTAGEVAYGNINTALATTLKGGFQSLDKNLLFDAVSVHCDAATIIGVSTTDDRASSVTASTTPVPTYNNDGSEFGNATHFLGLGTDNKGNSIGQYSGTFIGLKVDGKAANFSKCVLENDTTGATIEQGGALVVNNCPAGQSHLVMDASNQALSGTNFTWDYAVKPLVKSPKDLDPNGFKLDGSITVQVDYL
ncbi:hypothetical protein PU00_02400 [Hafnia alvei]|uniref:DUF1120 domain-containing protein n=1 Tax=Hafnia alvei TaxID=569 RepID=UPI000583973E|nr:DUF1120 domain-containing protein [Hafnia alvei]KID06191.1 hypothetical protein PU00_02400 [Hafnia alvei]